MSDADDAGADDSGFDKEAERERLREKYEEEQADREAAQQMSDLLLKGATMTNSHCGRCGSPIFRQDDQEFCPNCNVAAGDKADAAATANEAATADSADAASRDQPQDAQQTTDARTDPEAELADVIAGEETPDPDSQPVETGGTSIAERAAESVQSSEQPSAPTQSTAGSPNAQSKTAAPASEQPATQPTPSTGENASLADAQQSLLNAITQHARAATDADPRTATEHLEAAGEAAEALATISSEN
ncbi:Sjogren's syndrome/scleroderma autoantigen 1 family protein [Salinarchaeum laminariae]|uniref:Sjogren's syndrome/scleroderma autoantigen 1 family protein n=1 Tax=Salinarchaeum laminariae TaxID=869888 RepID=UPI0020BE13E9|nr:Sjogren's syndrome/scleroderma autoantigen 1 family protein [Salinarchaeum laminariae]